MTKPVTLSEAAFKALRSVKRQGESDSDVVLRLIAKQRDAKDPSMVSRLKIHPMFGSWDNYEKVLRQSKAAERRRMRQLYGDA